MIKEEVKESIRFRNQMLEVCEKMKNYVSIMAEGESIINDYDQAIYSIEKCIERIDVQLLYYCESTTVGRWLMKIEGMTFDIAAGLLAYFDIKDKEYAAQFIQYAGVGNKTQAHNNEIKKIVDKLSNNLIKEQNGYYANLRYNKYKELLKNKEISKVTATIRADRHMIKVFLSHLFEEMFREEHNGKLPKRSSNNENVVIIEPEVPYTQ